MDNLENDTKLHIWKGCANCCETKKMETFRNLTGGEHISIKGERSSSGYTHHLIINEVKSFEDNTGKKANVEVYHVMPNKVSRKSLIVKEDKYLDIDTNKVKLITYRGDNDRTEILKTAEYLYNKSQRRTNKSDGEPHALSTQHADEGQFNECDYKVFSNNCEHFCHYCCIKDKRSKQVYEPLFCCHKIVGSCCYSLPKLLRFLLKLLILSTDDFSRNVVIAGLILAALLLLYLIFVIMLNCQSIFFIPVSATECCKLPQNVFYNCADFPWFCCLKCNSSCIGCTCCRLKPSEIWYCEYCHNKQKCLRWLQFFIILICQGIGYGVLVIMIWKDFYIWCIFAISLGISLITMILYTFVPEQIFKRCNCFCPLTCKICCSVNINEKETVTEETPIITN